jgi:P27 family predicted phage terminase small subunit
LRGTRRKHREPKNEPKPEGDLFEAPSWLVTERQKASWTWHVTNAPPGLLRRLDRALLAAFCVAEAIHAEAVEQLAAAGTVLAPGSVAGTLVQHPLQRIIDKEALVLARLGAELGLSPASRSRIDVEPETRSNTDDPWAGLLD